MRKIWKFQVSNLEDWRLYIPMPEGAIFRYGGHDPILNETCIWMEVNPDAPTVMRKFDWYGTGHEIADNAIYMFSARDKESDTLLWHWFEIPA